MIDRKKIYNSIVPVLLGVFLFISNFLTTNIFDFGNSNFTVWFVLSVICFSCGWYINKTLGWQLGGKVIFSIIIAATLLGIIAITYFRNYFSPNELLTENLILYSLRNITLGAMAFFGMAIVEILTKQRDYLILQERLKTFEDTLKDAKKEAELELREAKVKAQKLLQDAEITAKNITLRKQIIEKQLQEFIQIEKELIKKYEELD
jgi:hypothetical protein